jgi:hypothetical protein
MLVFLQYASIKDPIKQAMLLDAEVTKQAAIVGYINAFKICMLINIAVIPLVFLLKSNKVSKPERILEEELVCEV